MSNTTLKQNQEWRAEKQSVSVEKITEIGRIQELFKRVELQNVWIGMKSTKIERSMSIEIWEWNNGPVTYRTPASGIGSIW